MLRQESIEYIRSMAERFSAEKIILFGSCLKVPEQTQEELGDY